MENLEKAPTIDIVMHEIEKFIKKLPLNKKNLKYYYYLILIYI
jgi:hypothetical protein